MKTNIKSIYHISKQKLLGKMSKQHSKMTLTCIKALVCSFERIFSCINEIFANFPPGATIPFQQIDKLHMENVCRKTV